jgi:LysM repeat protein
MAILSKDFKRVTVESGDTLSKIALDFLGSASSYKQLATINNISNPNLIYVGQTIKLTNEAGSGSGTASSTNSNKAKIDHFGIQSNADNTLFATWTWSKSNTASYKVLWTYDTGDGVWFTGTNSTNTVDKDAPSTSRQSTYSIPKNAKRVQFKVKPISETYKKNDTETHYWDAQWSDVKTWTVTVPLDVPSTPAIEIDKYKLTATLDNVNIENATHIEFQVVKNNSSSPFATKKASIVSSHASYAFNVDAGAEYKVRCRAHNSKSKVYSEWSSYSNNLPTIPAASSGITSIKANSETSVLLEWAAVSTATSYDVEYTTKKDYFDYSDQTTTKTGIDTTRYAITGLESGMEYFFRVRAVNEKGSSTWSGIKSVVIGKKPAAPTTWSSTTTAVTGEPVNLYWVHNAEDGSSETYAELELYIDGRKESYTIKNESDENEKDKTSSYSIDTSSYVEGTQIQWRVRTAGITKTYGDWSIQRTVDVYAPVTLELKMTDVNGNSLSVLESFPFYIYGLPGPKTQAPIGYHLAITSNEIYETVDSLGNPKIVNKGDEVYAKYFDTSQSLLVELSAGNIDLENNIEYTVTCTVSMNSGLTTEASLDFSVSWADEYYAPNAEIGIDEDTMTANIRPYCEDGRLVYYEVALNSGRYVKTATDLGPLWGEPIKNRKTTTGEQVYSGVTADGEDVYYCIVEEKIPVTDVLLAVYRREFDGKFTELATGLDSAKSTTITDPHPALDYARYRIVATTKNTGAVSYYDLPGYPVGGKAVIIQWDEDWSSFETSEEAALEQPPWAGSMLKLPYNIDVSDGHRPDVALVEYIGRSHPISYYGTQLGQTSSWSMVIEKDDEETLYALRRLANWMGDVYVREPSGSGYWANVTVSFSQKHCDMTIPVTLDITRVEGGV